MIIAGNDTTKQCRTCFSNKLKGKNRPTHDCPKKLLRIVKGYESRHSIIILWESLLWIGKENHFEEYCFKRRLNYESTLKTRLWSFNRKVKRCNARVWLVSWPLSQNKGCCQADLCVSCSPENKIQLYKSWCNSNEKILRLCVEDQSNEGYCINTSCIKGSHWVFIQ